MSLPERPFSGSPVIQLLPYLVISIILIAGSLAGARLMKLTPAIAALPPRAQWGYIDRTGKWIIRPQFDHVHPFHDGVAQVINSRSEFLVDKSGKPLGLSCEGLSDPPFQEGFALVENAPGRFWFVDKSGKRICPQNFEAALQFSEGLAPVKTAGKWGFIDSKGKPVIPAQFDYASQFADGLAVVELDKAKKWAYINKSGNIVIPPAKLQGLRYPGPFGEGMASVADSSMKVGFIDKQGNLVIPPKFAIAAGFHEGLCYFVERWTLDKGPGSDQYGYMDKLGHAVISPRFSSISDFAEGLAAVQPEYNGPWGFVDHTGKLVIPPQFRAASSFHEGLAVVLTSNGWAYIDKTGKIAITPDCFYQPGDFSEGLAASNVVVQEGNR